MSPHEQDQREAQNRQPASQQRGQYGMRKPRHHRLDRPTTPTRPSIPARNVSHASHLRLRDRGSRPDQQCLETNSLIAGRTGRRRATATVIEDHDLVIIVSSRWVAGSSTGIRLFSASITTRARAATSTTDAAATDHK